MAPWPLAANEGPSDHVTGAHAGEEEHPGGHVDPVAPVLIGIVLILLVAKVGGDLFERVGLPAVLGELSVGILLGNFALLTGSDVLEPLFRIPEQLPSPLPDDLSEIFYHPAAMLNILAGIGVVLLLFEVGLEANVSEMLSVGVSSLLVAVLGVVAPMFLGWFVGWLLIRAPSLAVEEADVITRLFPPGLWQVHVFIGATLCATSVGITARVLKDIGQSQKKEARIILGAAVIDDVLGLVVLAIVSGVILQGDVSFLGMLKIVGLAFGFLVAAMFLGAIQFPRTLFRAASYLRGHGLLVATSLVICFGFSYMASLVGLAPIIGAFAAGLILERSHYREAGAKLWENSNLEDALAPLTALLVPIFFVGMGAKVDLRSFQNPEVWGLAAAITFVAILGKQVCSFGVREKGLNKIAVGLGMIPRGEVGLIFADVGNKLIVNGERVIDSGTYSAIVVMVMITTMLTPPLLKWSLARSKGDAEDNTDGDTDGDAPTDAAET
jgi:Kef-type K+ transport system membrane component KefB